MSKFFTILTQVGEAKLANATALGQTIRLAQLAIGDGNGVLPTPDQKQTALINELRREPLNAVDTDPNNPNWIICEQVIPENVGGWTIREIGLYDGDGDLVAVGNFPETYKPVLAEGSGRTQTVRVVLQVSASSSVELKIDPAIVLATREYVDKQDNDHAEDLNPHPQYVLASVGQFLPYDPERCYSVGEICYTKDPVTRELSYWQWYSNREYLTGKDPINIAHRHPGWKDTTKPFYWIPYTGDQVGTPFFWLDTTPPEWAVMEINVDLPVAVYWRLARTYPHLVNNGVINTGEIRGEFLRVLDQGRGVDSGRTLGSYQAGTKITGEVGDPSTPNGHTIANINDVFGDPLYEDLSEFDATINYSRTNLPIYEPWHVWWVTTRPRNTARPMAIAI
ncbi:phage tail protein [Vibrio ostreicida]|uniref:phage tail protein n=1 Tax=Vibrio ostreicida TaxID=526588 RepID=UPI003B59AB20